MRRHHVLGPLSLGALLLSPAGSKAQQQDWGPYASGSIGYLHVVMPNGASPLRLGDVQYLWGGSLFNPVHSAQQPAYARAQWLPMDAGEDGSGEDSSGEDGSGTGSSLPTVVQLDASGAIRFPYLPTPVGENILAIDCGVGTHPGGWNPAEGAGAEIVGLWRSGGTANDRYVINSDSTISPQYEGQPHRQFKLALGPNTWSGCSSNFTTSEGYLQPRLVLATADQSVVRMVTFVLQQGPSPSLVPSPSPSPVALLCTDSCIRASDGICDDGGPGAEYFDCQYGIDCTDCGPRWPNPTPLPDSAGPDPSPQSTQSTHDCAHVELCAPYEYCHTAPDAACATAFLQPFIRDSCNHSYAHCGYCVLTAGLYDALNMTSLHAQLNVTIFAGDELTGTLLAAIQHALGAPAGITDDASRYIDCMLMTCLACMCSRHRPLRCQVTFALMGFAQLLRFVWPNAFHSPRRIPIA